MDRTTLCCEGMPLACAGGPFLRTGYDTRDGANLPDDFQWTRYSAGIMMLARVGAGTAFRAWLKAAWIAFMVLFCIRAYFFFVSLGNTGLPSPASSLPG